MFSQCRRNNYQIQSHQKTHTLIRILKSKKKGSSPQVVRKWLKGENGKCSRLRKFTCQHLCNSEGGRLGLPKILAGQHLCKLADSSQLLHFPMFFTLKNPSIALHMTKWLITKTTKTMQNDTLTHTHAYFILLCIYIYIYILINACLKIRI